MYANNLKSWPIVYKLDSRYGRKQTVAYLNFLASDGLKVSFLSDDEGVDEDLCAGGDCHFEIVTVFFNFRNTLDVLAFLDELIRET